MEKILSYVYNSLLISSSVDGPLLWQGSCKRKYLHIWEVTGRVSWGGDREVHLGSPVSVLPSVGSAWCLQVPPEDESLI